MRLVRASSPSRSHSKGGPFLSRKSYNWSHAQVCMGVQFFFLMTTATCFMRQEAPGCSATSSEMEAIKPAWLRIGCAGSAFEALPRAEGRDFSFPRSHMQLANGASSLSVCRQRSLRERQRVFTAHCPQQQNKTDDCHTQFFSGHSGLDCFTSRLRFPLLFFKSRKCLGSTKQVP